MTHKLLLVLALGTICMTSAAQGPRRGFQREAFQTETPMAHDPVMAKEGDTYYIYATGMGIQQMTSKDRKTWTVLPQPVMTVIPGWTTDSVPGFGNHVWAPDVIQWHGSWWLAYSCSTFGKNGSAIGLLSSRSLRANIWKDEGCIVTSHDWKRGADGQMTGDNWNAIDPNFVIDDDDTPWLVWGSFWDGIQLARLDSTMHLAKGASPEPLHVDTTQTTSPRSPTPLRNLPARTPSKHRSSSNTADTTTFLCRGTTAVVVPKATTAWPSDAARVSKALTSTVKARTWPMVAACSSWRATRRNGRLPAIVQPTISTMKTSSSAMVTVPHMTAQPCSSSGLLFGLLMVGLN